MSENQSRSVNDLSKYDMMTTEELEEILRLDAEAPERQESDTETLINVMEVLAKRKKNIGRTENTAQRAYESFQKNYLPEIEDNINAHNRKGTKKKKPLCWLRGLSVAAAVLVVVFLGSVTAKAFGYDIWEAVVQWTQDTFHFGDGRQNSDGPGTDGDLEHASLQEVLVNAGIAEPLVPTWIPDGYQLTDIRVDESPLQDVYRAQYIFGKKELMITVRNHLNSDPQYVEQSDDHVEIYEVNGIEYYLLANNERIRAVWINSSFECYILGDLTIEELKQMIDSIEKG